MSNKVTKIRIGERVRKLRKDRKLSQEDLAAEIDKSVETISHIERGIFLPRLDTAQNIADVLQVPLYELFLYDIAETEKTKVQIIHQILDLLEDQPIDLLRTAQDQIKSFIALKNALSTRE